MTSRFAKTATVVRVTTDIMVMGNPATALWIVGTDDRDEAVRIVQNRVGDRRVVEATNSVISQETIERYGLTPGAAHHL